MKGRGVSDHGVVTGGMRKEKGRDGTLPSLSMTDLTRTFWEKGTCMIICGKQGRMI